MTPERWNKLEAVFHEALELQGEARAAFLAKVCGSDKQLREEAERLIAAHEKEGSFMDSPIVEKTAEQADHDRFESPLGHNIGPYKVIRQVGWGGMGEIYLAEDTRLGRKVALKLLPAEFTRDAERVRRLEQEARAASALNHPNIVTIHEVGQVDSTHYIVTEFVEGDTLRQQMTVSNLGISAALDVAAQVASALSAAHAAGIVHRDIKPENLMMRPDSLVKVLDFGLAKLTEPGRATVDTNAPAIKKSLTEPGQVMGTPHYMSPEQARGVGVDARSDIFSLGVVLYEMIAGRVPFEGATPTDVIISILQQEPAPLARYAPEVPRELEQVVAKALCKNPEDRYQTARELLLDLKGLKQRLELEPVSGLVRDAAARVTRSEGEPVALRTWPWALAAGVVILFTVGWLWLAWRAPETPVKPETPVIAVLPFKNLSAEKDSEYFADGLTDELIRNLSLIEGLEVRSRTSSFAFKDKALNIREVGEKLRADWVLDGSVLWSRGNLRINAQFARVSDDKPLWTGRFDRELKDIFTIQDEISRGIVNQLRVNLGRGRRRYETSVEAYDLYLRARGRSGAPGPRQVEAIGIYEQVVAKDPSFAPAWAGLASSYARQSVGFPVDNPADAVAKLQVAAEKAIQLDPLLAEAHAALAMMHARDGRWEQAENSFRQAIRLDPNRSDTFSDYSNWLLLASGRVADALEQMQYAVKADPLSPDIKAVYGNVLISAGRYDEAESYLQQLPDDHALKRLHLARVRLGQGRIGESIQLLENDPTRSRNPQIRGFLGYAYARSGRREEAEKMAAESEPANVRALIFAGLGDKDRTLEALERMGSRGPQRIGMFLTRPEFAFLRGDPRLTDLRKKVGLPE
jgi:TolB-like protein/Tfp pilus assembly protein PilF